MFNLSLLRSLVLSLFLCCIFSLQAAVGDDNIVIDKMTVDVKVDVKDGRPERIKEVTTYLIRAQRNNEGAILYHYYDNDATVINKVSGGSAKYMAAESGSLFYTGSRICAVPLELKPGKATKVSFECTYLKPEHFTGIIVGSLYDILKANINIHIPNDLLVDARIAEHNMPAGVIGSSTDSDKERLYSLSVENIPAFKDAPAATSATNWWPYVSADLTFGSVDSLYAYLSSVARPESLVAPSVAEMARSITKGLSDDISKINAIAAWVRQNIRYVAIVNGEWGHRPDRAEAVLEKRFGDCKGSANLIRAMLRAVGIDGRLVWIGTRDSAVEPWSVSHSISSGNHMIAAAVLPDTTLYLDGTVKFAPDGYLPYGDSECEVLVENGDSFLLTSTPPVSNAGNLIEYTAELSVDGTALGGPTKLTHRGAPHIYIQSFVNDVTASRRESALNAILCNDRKGVTTRNPTLESASPNSGLTTISANLTDGGAVKAASAGEKLYVSPRPLRYHSFDTFSAKSRRAPFSFGTPVNYTASLKIAIPEGYTPEALPKRIDIDSEWFKGFVEYTAGPDNTILCNARLSTLSTYGLGSQLDQWNAAVRQINKASNTPIIFTK